MRVRIDSALLCIALPNMALRKRLGDSAQLARNPSLFPSSTFAHLPHILQVTLRESHERVINSNTRPSGKGVSVILPCRGSRPVRNMATLNTQHSLWLPCRCFKWRACKFESTRSRDHARTAVLCLLVHDRRPTDRYHIPHKKPLLLLVRCRSVDRSYHPFYGRCYVAC